MATTNDKNGSAVEAPLPLPKVTLTPVANGLALLEPLSRQGTGPGLIVVPHPSTSKDQRIDIFSNPDGVELEFISRTIGLDRVIDEFISS